MYVPRSLGSTVCHAPPNTYVPLCDTDTLRYVTNKTRQNGLQTADRQEGGEGTVTRGTPERKSAWQDCQPNLPAVILTTTLLPAWVLPRPGGHPWTLCKLHFVGRARFHSWNTTTTLRAQPLEHLFRWRCKSAGANTHGRARPPRSARIARWPNCRNCPEVGASRVKSSQSRYLCTRRRRAPGPPRAAAAVTLPTSSESWEAARRAGPSADKRGRIRGGLDKVGGGGGDTKGGGQYPRPGGNWWLFIIIHLYMDIGPKEKTRGIPVRARRVCHARVSTVNVCGKRFSSRTFRIATVSQRLRAVQLHI